MAEIVLISGDQFLVAAALAEERKTALGDLDPNFALAELEPGAGFASDLAATAMLGLGADRRVAVVRRAGSLSDDDWKALLAYVADPPEHVTLILEGTAWTFPARSRALGDAVRKSAAPGRVRREEPPPANKRSEFVRQTGGTLGVRVDGGAARLLAELLGEDIGSVGGVLDQLRTTYGERISEADVAATFEGARQGAHWDLTDSLDRGDAAAALELLAGALMTSHPFALHAALVTHYRRQAWVAGRRLSAPAAAAELGISEFPAKKSVDQARRIGVDGARRAFELVATADVALRGGQHGLDARTILEVLVVELAGLVPRKHGRRR